MKRVRMNAHRNQRIKLVIAMVAVAAGAGCGYGADKNGVVRQLGLTFDEFEARTYREADTGIYIVDGDVPIIGRDRLRDYYEHSLRDGALTVNQAVKGVDDTWDINQQLDLSFCVSTAFGTNYDRAVQAMDDAARAWREAAFVRFAHYPEQDGNCNAANDAVVFDVRPTSGQKYLARSFFPSTSRANRNVLIDSASFSVNSPLTLTGILRHELGHALGLRHEHLRPEQGGTCTEVGDWRALTPYDSGSVMHYPQCKGTNPALALSQRDRDGISSLYPYPPGSLIGLGGKCLDLLGWNTDDRAPVAMWDCDGAANQQWSYDDALTLRGWSDKRLEVLDFNIAEGAPVGVDGANGWANQQWSFQNVEIRGYYGKNLDLLGWNTAEGAPVCIWDADGAANQKWTFTDAGEIRGYADKCLDVYGSSTDNGTPVLTYSCYGTANQQWRIQPGGQIVGIGNKCLTVQNVSTTNGAGLVIWDCTGAANQKWSLRGEVRGYGDHCLDVYGWHTENGTAVNTYSCHGSTNQRWAYYP